MTPGPATAATPWFARPHSADQPARIFCFPYSGSGASAFSAWPASIAGTEICPLQFPGRENRLGEPHYGTYEKLAAELAEALRPRLDRPFALFGHCAGALHALETAALLPGLGLPQPDCFVVSGQAPPHDGPRDRMLSMTEAELRGELEAVVRSRGIDPRPDIVDVGLAVLLKDLAAAREYRRTEPVPLGCPLVVLHWRDDPEVSLDQLQGWRQYSDTVQFHVIDGGHHDFMNAPRELQELVTCWR
ncbi:thioesterase II family protein [Streptomyces microflavus]|uniref:thioesterase II family protein n=1 Tax=Streptomyces microflavus TaxID=1919 RepID=UPI0033EFA6FC